VVTSASDVIVSGAKVNYLAGATTATVVIPSLKAVTDYDVYCAAVTVNGVANTDSAVLATKKDATTDCCNSLAYTNAPSYVYGSLTKYATPSAVPVFAYTLSAAPRGFVVITPVVRNATGHVVSSSVLTVQPAMVNFTSSSNLAGRFILSGSALLEGVFTIELKPSGTSSGDYESNIFITTTVLSSATKAPAPALLSAKFDNSGASITVTFDSATNRALISKQSFPCSDLLAFVNVNFTTCSWKSSSVVHVVFTTAPVNTLLLNVGDTLFLRANLVKAACIAPADCTFYDLAHRQSVPVLIAETPVVPNVRVRVPALISGCDDFIIDPSLSSGSGGRAWIGFTWSVTYETAFTSGAATAIEAALNAYGPTTATSMSIPQALLSSARYTVSLTLKNFFGE